MTVQRKYDYTLKQCILLFAWLSSSMLLAQDPCDDLFLMHPRDGIICKDNQVRSHTFTVFTLNIFNCEYQWEKWNTITLQWEHVSGEINSEYTTNEEGRYRCEVTATPIGGGVPLVCSSEEATLLVGFIREHPIAPADGSICEYDSHVFSIEMAPAVNNVNPNYVYMWQRRTTGDWTNNHTPNGWPQTNSGNPGEYRCMVTITRNNVQCIEYSNSISIDVHKAPDIPVISARSACIDSVYRASFVEELLVTNGRDLTTFTWRFAGAVHDSENNVVDNKVRDLVIDRALISHNNTNITLTIGNSCGTATSMDFAMSVRSRPALPTPNDTTYCQGGTARRMYIFEQNQASWFAFDNPEREISPPMPNTSPDTSALQQWYVLQRVRYNDGTVCQSEKTTASVRILELSNPPIKRDTTVCLNVRDLNIRAIANDGSSLRWYDRNKNQISVAPQIQINTSRPEIQIYYVTQTDPGKCESITDLGQINVDIRDISDIERMSLIYSQDLCPEKTARIDVESSLPDAIFRWYASSDKATAIPGADNTIYIGKFYETPPLSDNTAYYVSIQYVENGLILCESTSTKAAVIYVRDIEAPWFDVRAPNIVINTLPNACHAIVPLGTSLVKVDDNCSDVVDLKVFIDAEGITPPNDYILPEELQFEMGDTTLIWWVQDQAGNKDYALQSIQVRDRVKPHGECPDVIWEIDENDVEALVTFRLNHDDNCSKKLSYEHNRGERAESMFRIVGGAFMPIDTVFTLTGDTLFQTGSNDTIAFTARFMLGSTPMRYLIYDESNNVDTCTFNVIVRRPYRPMLVSLRVSNTEICPNQPVIITPVITGGSGQYTYLWKPNGRTTSVMHEFPRESVTYEVTIDDGVLPPITESVFIRVLETQPLNLTVDDGKTVTIIDGNSSDEVRVVEGDEILVTATPGFQNYRLLFNNRVVQMTGTNNIISFIAELGDVDIQVFATDENGCVSSIRMRTKVANDIIVENKQIPNVFTPSLIDGKNDVFMKDRLKKEGELLQIFNRAGVLLYEGREGWDGKFRDELMPKGVYWYVIRRIESNGEVQIHRGEVTLL